MLVVLRGNAASGKTTVARLLQSQLDGPVAVLSQDHFRRDVYAEREQESLAQADLLEAAARHCLARGHHVILDGIFHAGRYGPMLQRIAAASDDARFYAFDLTFAETVRRHATRPKAGDFSAEEMASWHHGWQPLDFVAEHRITAAETPEEVVERILLHA